MVCFGFAIDTEYLRQLLVLRRTLSEYLLEFVRGTRLGNKPLLGPKSFHRFENSDPFHKETVAFSLVILFFIL
jgi:hypothetical protein